MKTERWKTFKSKELFGKEPNTTSVVAGNGGMVSSFRSRRLSLFLFFVSLCSSRFLLSAETIKFLSKHSTRLDYCYCYCILPRFPSPSQFPTDGRVIQTSNSASCKTLLGRCFHGEIIGRRRTIEAAFQLWQST